MTAFDLIGSSKRKGGVRWETKVIVDAWSILPRLLYLYRGLGLADSGKVLYLSVA